MSIPPFSAPPSNVKLTALPVNVLNTGNTLADAVMDGSTHPLSTRFASLAAAQAVFPKATALSQEIDWAAIQTALDTSNSIYLPTGTALTDTVIRLPQGNCQIIGNGRTATTIKMRSSANKNIISAVNGQSTITSITGSTTLPASNITITVNNAGAIVASDGFDGLPTSGTIVVRIGTTYTTLTYTAVSGNNFTGVNGGTAGLVLAAGQIVTVYNPNMVIQGLTLDGNGTNQPSANNLFGFLNWFAPNLLMSDIQIKNIDGIGYRHQSANGQWLETHVQHYGHIFVTACTNHGFWIGRETRQVSYNDIIATDCTNIGILLDASEAHVVNAFANNCDIGIYINNVGKCRMDKLQATSNNYWGIYVVGLVNGGASHWLTENNGKKTVTVTAATNATPIVVTSSAAHAMTDGQTVAIAAVTGNTAANGNYYARVTGAGGSTKFSLYGSASTASSGSTNTVNISDATNATPIVVTSAAHGLVTGDFVTIASVGGNTAANGTFYVRIPSTNPTTTFQLYTTQQYARTGGATGAVAGNGAYTSGGTVSVGPVAGNSAYVSGGYINTYAWPSNITQPAKLPAETSDLYVSSDNRQTYGVTANSVITQVIYGFSAFPAAGESAIACYGTVIEAGVDSLQVLHAHSVGAQSLGADLLNSNALFVHAEDTLSATGTTTLTNKRVTRRVVTVTQSATPTINTDNTDVASITGLAQAITSMTTNLSGTPVAGDMLRIDITDDGTGRAITWGSGSFEASGNIALPTTTVASTLLSTLFEWNAATSHWRCVGVA